MSTKTSLFLISALSNAVTVDIEFDAHAIRTRPCTDRERPIPMVRSGFTRKRSVGRASENGYRGGRQAKTWTEVPGRTSISRVGAKPSPS